ncbi:MAG: radical SAM family heme chaperone HemW [Gammaproteobacteria bacterium]|nr:radical SAM family heme chaperone HemW [Gammaproteobacteria bacterium]
MNTALFSTIPLSLYIHIPWCERKCPYCDFNSHTAEKVIPEKKYIQALLSDLQHDLEWVHGREIGSIFIGGGTPSLLKPVSYQQLFDGLQKELSFAHDIEITLEANPGSAEQQKFTEFYDTGINRLSIGVQSFDDEMLSRLGRIHNGKDAIKAAEAAHYAGFENFNLDLMFALPGQDSHMAIKDLKYATSLEPSHISWYQLTIEPNTLFHHQPPVLPIDDQIADMQTLGQEHLANKNYQQYEISAYSQGVTCRHNLNYWKFGDYLGLGAGAHSKLCNTDNNLIIRKQRLRHPEDYMNQAHLPEVISQQRELDSSDIILEFMMNALRLNEGVSYEQFEAHTLLEIDSIQPQLELARKQELLVDNKRIQPSARGLLYLNNLLEIFMGCRKAT